MNAGHSHFNNTAYTALAFLSVKEASALLGVSDATIRNWIKCGELCATQNGSVDYATLQDFKVRKIGKIRLVQRANKTRKTASNYEEVSEQIRRALKEGNAEQLAASYEQALSESYRNREGIYYTPQQIVEDMMREVAACDLREALFLDPCCGSGNFILQAAQLGIQPQNIYGYDTDANAVQIAKHRLKEATGYDSPNIVCADFLCEATHLQERFDFIYTNPLWGKKLSREAKCRFAQMFGAGKSNDTASLFLFATLPLLKPKGKLGFLLPEAVLNIGGFEQTRETLLQYRLERIADYDKPFKGVLTKAYGIVLTKLETEAEHKVTCQNSAESYLRRQQSFVQMPKHIFNVWAREEDVAVINRLYATKHIRLTQNVQWGLGIVTGNNQLHCKTAPAADCVPIYRGKDVMQGKLAQPHYYINQTLQGCQQIAPMNLYLSKEKLIYRFISDRLIFYNDQAQTLILNSANMLVPQAGFPLSGSSLSQMLNSDIMNWLYVKIFKTHKVLRSDLEALPIFTDYARRDTFDENALLLDLNIQKENGTFRIKG